jgi:CheY-like chemotaxis protein
MLYSLSDMLHRTLDQRIRIDIEVPPLRLLVLADAGQLESALLNIALNSRDAMPNGGTLRFRANVCDTLPSAALEALDDPTQASEHYVELVITDNGSGMSTEVKARAFEPFYTTKAVGRGTGLGLSTVYGYIKQSKGSITIESEPGVGTEIALYIPRLLNSDVEALGNEPEQAQVPPGMKVLLVEDDAAVCEVVHAFLIGLGCAVEAVDSAEKALEQIAHTPFDLLVSDVALGAGMRGTELSELARSRAPALPVLLMSGYSSELLDIDAGASASQDLLRKPFTQAALGRAITKLFAARTAN